MNTSVTLIFPTPGVG